MLNCDRQINYILQQSIYRRFHAVSILDLRRHTIFHVIEREPTRDLRQHCMHPPLIRRVYAECSPLIQLIKLINILKADKYDTILEKIISKSHTYHGFSFNVTTICLNAYDPICRINQCYICNR